MTTVEAGIEAKEDTLGARILEFLVILDEDMVVEVPSDKV